jgi:hypothetical protein
MTVHCSKQLPRRVFWRSKAQAVFAAARLKTEPYSQSTADAGSNGFDDEAFGPVLHRFLAEQFPTPSRYERPDDGVESAGSIVYVGVPST